MNRIAKLVVLTLAAAFVLLLAALLVSAPRHPVAIIRVVDATGQPITNAIVTPEGLRTKAGPYRSGWYGWPTRTSGVTNHPVRTDAAGVAVVPYPKYVFELIETGTLCLSVFHPDFVAARPECVVATAPPAGAPWRARAIDIWERVRRKKLVTRPDPVTLQFGATLQVAITADALLPDSVKVFAQVSHEPYGDDDFWQRTNPRTLVTRRLEAGKHLVRAIGLETNGAVWFSAEVPVNAAPGQTNEFTLTLRRGVNLQGRLDDAVPRPVRNGRVVAHVTPHGAKLQEEPPQWHAWATIQPDGSFAINSLPAGDLEITTLCDGFVSTNGPGQFGMHYPQRAVLGSNDLQVVIGMEPTTRLEVKVTDEHGRALKGVRVRTWPNVRYGEWSATILMSDCYNTADFLQAKPDARAWWDRRVPDFEGVSDASGLAILPNLPVNVSELAVEHAEYELPAVGAATGQQRRQASFTLAVGPTNRISIQLEPRERSQIRHY